MSSGSDEDGFDFAAIESQAHANMTLEEANKLNRQKLTGQNSIDGARDNERPAVEHSIHRVSCASFVYVVSTAQRSCVRTTS